MRVLSLSPGLTELLFSLGAGDQLVGRTDGCTYPDPATKIPSIGPASEVSGELVDVFEPELVLTGPGQTALSESLGKKYSVIYFDPQSFADMFAGINEIARLLGKQVEAEMLLHDLQLALDKVRERARVYHTIRTYVEAGHTPPVVASGYVAELVGICGGTCFTGEPTVDAIQAFDPQFVISCVPGEDGFDFEFLTARDGWGSLSAVTYERLFTIPGELMYNPGPRLILGIETMARILHGISL